MQKKKEKKKAQAEGNISHRQQDAKCMSQIWWSSLPKTHNLFSMTKEVNAAPPSQATTIIQALRK